MHATGPAAQSAAARPRRRTLAIVGVALVCGFVAFMAVVVWALQGLDAGGPRSPWPLVVLAVAVAAPLALGYALRRSRGVAWALAGVAAGVVGTGAGLSVLRALGAALTG